MAHVLFAVTGSRYWTLNDGTQHPCGYWPEELAVPHEVFTEAGYSSFRRVAETPMNLILEARP